MTRFGDKWTEEEELELLQELRKKKKISDIAQEHGRTERAIQMRMEYLAKKMTKSHSIADIASCMNQNIETIETWIAKEPGPSIQGQTRTPIDNVLIRIEQRLEHLEQMVDKIYKRLKTLEKKR